MAVGSKSCFLHTDKETGWDALSKEGDVLLTGSISSPDKGYQYLEILEYLENSAFLQAVQSNSLFLANISSPKSDFSFSSYVIADTGSLF